MNRRTFLKFCSLATHGLAFGFGTTGCAIPPKDIKWSELPEKDFSIVAFDDWFITHKLYNGVNPNLKITQRGKNTTTKAAINSSNNSTPGIDYQSGVLYAAAGGEVARIIDLDKIGTGRAGGYMLYVSHPVAGPNMMDWVITTSYAHIFKPQLEVGQRVERGDKIADVLYPDFAKLMLQRWQYFVDPDNYGQNHSYMNYWDEKTDLDIQDTRERCLKQEQIYWQLRGKASPWLYEQLRNNFPKSHRNDFKKKHLWDFFEMFRYLEELYNAKPNLFPNLDRTEFNILKEEFYANQPIVLTLCKNQLLLTATLTISVP
jgi:hypothetical protein